MATLCLGALGFVVPACGGPTDEGELDAFAKAPAPTLPAVFHGEPLAHWIDATRHADPVNRAEAAWALGELGAGQADAHEPLRRLFRDPDPDVRFAAFAALQHWGYVMPEAMPDVLRGTTDDEPAIARLADVSVAYATPAMLAQALTAPDATAALQAAAAERLATHGAAAVAPLRAALEAPEASVRQLAIETLGALGGAAASAVPDLIARIIEPAPIGPAAASALGRIGTPAKAALEAFVASEQAAGNANAKLLAQLALARIK